MTIEGIELRVPEAAVAGDPFRGAREWCGGEAAAMDAAVALAHEQARTLEDAEVLRDGRERHVEGLRQLGHRGFGHGEPRQHRAARGIGQRAERRIEDAGRHRHYASASTPDSSSVAFPSVHRQRSRPSDS